MAKAIPPGPRFPWLRSKSKTKDSSPVWLRDSLILRRRPQSPLQKDGPVGTQTKCPLEGLPSWTRQDVSAQGEGAREGLPGASVPLLPHGCLRGRLLRVSQFSEPPAPVLSSLTHDTGLISSAVSRSGTPEKAGPGACLAHSRALSACLRGAGGGMRAGLALSRGMRAPGPQAA